MTGQIKNIFDIRQLSMGRKFGLLGRLYIGVLSKKLKALGIEKQFSVLVLLNVIGSGCNQKFISDMLHIDKTMMVGIVDYLSEAGYIRRVQNEKDRREYILHLTPKGKSSMPLIMKEVSQLNKQIMKGIAETDINNLHNQLGIIYYNLIQLTESN